MSSDNAHSAHADDHGHGPTVAESELIKESSPQDWLLILLAAAAMGALAWYSWQWAGTPVAHHEHEAEAQHQQTSVAGEETQHKKTPAAGDEAATVEHQTAGQDDHATQGTEASSEPEIDSEKAAETPSHDEPAESH